MVGASWPVNSQAHSTFPNFNGNTTTITSGRQRQPVLGGSGRCDNSLHALIPADRRPADGNNPNFDTWLRLEPRFRSVVPNQAGHRWAVLERGLTAGEPSGVAAAAESGAVRRSTIRRFSVFRSGSGQAVPPSGTCSTDARTALGLVVQNLSNRAPRCSRARGPAVVGPRPDRWKLRSVDRRADRHLQRLQAGPHRRT